MNQPLDRNGPLLSRLSSICVGPCKSVGRYTHTGRHIDANNLLPRVGNYDEASYI